MSHNTYYIRLFAQFIISSLTTMLQHCSATQFSRYPLRLLRCPSSRITQSWWNLRAQARSVRSLRSDARFFECDPWGLTQLIHATMSARRDGANSTLPNEEPETPLEILLLRQAVELKLYRRSTSRWMWSICIDSLCRSASVVGL